MYVYIFLKHICAVNMESFVFQSFGDYKSVSVFLHRLAQNCYVLEKGLLPSQQRAA